MKMSVFLFVSSAFAVHSAEFASLAAEVLAFSTLATCSRTKSLIFAASLMSKTSRANLSCAATYSPRAHSLFVSTTASNVLVPVRSG